MKTRFVGMVAAPALLGGLRTLLALAVTCVVLAVSVCAMSSSSATAATIYAVDLPPTGDLTLTGTITTDGNLGALTLSNFLDWDLTVSSTSLSASYEFFGPAHGPTSNSTLHLAQDNVVATYTTLFLPYPGVFDLEAGGCNACGQAVVTPSPPGFNVEYFRVCNSAGACDEVEIGLSLSGVQLADAGVQTSSDNNDQGGNNNDQGENNNDQGNNLSQVPLPATLPLFATGLGALGLLGWRRKKAATG